MTLKFESHFKKPKKREKKNPSTNLFPDFSKKIGVVLKTQIFQNFSHIILNENEI